MPVNDPVVTSVAIDGRLVTGERRGIGKGLLLALRSMVRLPAPVHFDVLLDHAPPPGLIDPGPNWSWVVMRPGVYPVWEQVRMPLYARRHRPGVLHATGNTGPVIRPPAATRFVLTVYDFIFDERWPLQSQRQRLGRRYRRAVLPRAIPHADWLICISEATRTQLIERFPGTAARSSVVPIPIDDRLLAPLQAPSTPADPAVPSKPFLVAFGGVDPRKNVGRIVEAFSQVRAQIPEAELVLVGAQGSILQQRGQGIRALAYVPEPLLIELYRRSAGLVYPSLSEGLGVPILEAMALGSPVITSNRDPMRELGGDVAILVEPEDVDAIATAMIRVMKAPADLKHAADRGRRRAAAFTASRVAEQIVEIYLRRGQPAR